MATPVLIRAALPSESELQSFARAAAHLLIERLPHALGSRTVNLFYDHDSIHVGLTSGLFTKIRLKVTGNAVFMRDLHVTFASGAGADIPVRFMVYPR